MSKLSGCDNVDIKKMDSVSKVSNVSKVSKFQSKMSKVSRCYTINSIEIKLDK